MAKKANQNDRDIELTDTFLGQSYKHQIINSLSPSLSSKQTDLSDKSDSSHYSSILIYIVSRKGERKVQGVPQSHIAALPRPQEEEETDKSKQAQTE